MQGTYYFMAISLLMVPAEGIVHTISHDLESFYWVLVWIVLRYTNHAHPDGDNTFLNVFPAGDDNKCATSKQVWLKFGAKKLTIPDNQPLTDLMLKLSAVVMKHYLLDALDYDMILQCFDDALAPDKKWPESDKAVPRALPDLRTNSVMPANNRMGSRKKRRTGGGSKRKANDSEPPPLPEGAEGPVYYDDDADPVAVRAGDEPQAPAAAGLPAVDIEAAQDGHSRDAAPEQPSKRRKTNPGNRSSGSRYDGVTSTGSDSGMPADGSAEMEATPQAGPSTGTRSKTRAANGASRGTGSGRATGSRQGSGREGPSGSRTRRARGGSGSGKLRR